MGLSKELISQFAKVTNDDKKTKKESTVYGTIPYEGDNGNWWIEKGDSSIDTGVKVTNVGENETYVHIDGAFQDGKPALVRTATTSTTLPGDRVIVAIRNHSAVVTGNLTTPSVTVTKTVEVVETKVEYVVADHIKATNAEIEKVKTDYVKTSTLEADYIKADAIAAKYAKADEAQIKYAEFDTLNADYGKFKTAYAETLEATEADIDELEANTAHINEVMFGSAAGNTLQTSFANAIIALIGDAQIKSAMIDSLDAAKIKAGSIDTNKVHLASEDGSLSIFDNLIQIKDGSNVRIQIGKDASGEYSILICDESGATMFDANGITENAIKEAIIVNDMIADDANISGSKIDINSLITSINENGTTTISSSKVQVNNESLDVSFKKLSDDVTANGTQITAMNDKIESKVWQQDIDKSNAELTTKYSELQQDIDGISHTVASHALTMATKNDLAAVNSKFEHDQLVVNGGGEMGNNTNFSKFDFDGINTHNSAGSFTKKVTTYREFESDEKFLVSPHREYTLSVDAKSQENDITEFYAFLHFYDIDGEKITCSNHTHIKASTTTLTQDLKWGDTVIYVSDLSGWSPTGTQGVLIWNYTNSYGYTYPPNTYTRNKVSAMKDATTGTLVIDPDAGTITLSAPYADDTIPAGTHISQGVACGSYKYLVHNVKPGTEWKSYSGKISGVDETGTNAMYKFPPGAAYASVGFLCTNSQVTDQIWVTNISVRDTTELSETDQRLTTSEASAESLGSRLTVTESTIQQLVDRISMLVTDGKGTSLMTQTEDGWTFSTSELESTINKTSEDLSELVQQCGNTDAAVEILQEAVSDLGIFTEYVKIGTYEDEPCIELGEGDSNFKLVITNTRIMFMDGSDVPAYINNKSLYIKKAVIQEELHQGGYAWVTRSNGHLSLVWKGASD